MIESKWTLKREVSIPDLIAIVMAIVLPLGAYYTLKNEVELVKIRQDLADSLARDAKEDSRQLKTELREDIREIKTNIQRLTERSSK